MTAILTKTTSTGAMFAPIPDTLPVDLAEVLDCVESNFDAYHVVHGETSTTITIPGKLDLEIDRTGEDSYYLYLKREKEGEKQYMQIQDMVDYVAIVTFLEGYNGHV